MTTVDTAELRRRLNAATPGPWHIKDRGIGWSVHTDGSAETCTWDDADLMDYDGLGKGVFSESQAAYIAAANPQAIKQLLDERDALEGALALVEEIMLMTDERDDSVPLTDWLPDEWVDKADALLNRDATRQLLAATREPQEGEG